jgi:predicted TIM-barrel fold metal-dependent hydrolase
MRIDSHHRVWDLRVRPQPWTAGLQALQRSYGMDDLRPSLARHDIDATIVVQTVAVAADVVGWTDLTAADVADRTIELTENACAGLPEVEKSTSSARRQHAGTRSHIRVLVAPGRLADAVEMLKGELV